MALPSSMKAIQVVAFGKPYQINTVAVPARLGAHELLVKVAVASYCHTDSMVIEGVFGGNKLPLTASHEGSGTVVAVGSSPGTFKVGDRVMCGIFFNACNHCAACTTGPECQRQYCTGGYEGNAGAFDADGFFAEYARVDARWTTHLPDTVSLLAAAPLACAGRTIWRGVQQAIQRAGLKTGSWMAIVGSGGGLGHMGIQFARSAGLRVIGIDARDEALQVTRASGADVVLDARAGQEATVAAVHKAVGSTASQGRGGGAEATLVLSDVPEASALACAVTKNHGTVVQVAQPEKVIIPFQEFILRDIRLYGTLVASPQESQEMVDFIAKHGIHVQTETYAGLNKIEELLHHVHGGRLKGKAAIIVDQAQLDLDNGAAVNRSKI
ncbi:hypothetical protein SCUCBS95973_001353 [Sporothrix curviconia]|uniref:Enoyl reductase (ER) domain-containing protein n=1 Tax=Sporothrix curviconia TaxID=1260050 RepID=A0ABP0AYA0_9PEZI